MGRRGRAGGAAPGGPGLLRAVAYRIFGHLAAADDEMQKTSLRLNRLAPLTFVLHDMSYVPVRLDRQIAG